MIYIHVHARKMVILEQRRIEKCCVKKASLGLVESVSFSCNRLIVTGKLFTASFSQDGEYCVLKCPRQCFSSALQMIECVVSKYIYSLASDFDDHGRVPCSRQILVVNVTARPKQETTIEFFRFKIVC